MVVRTPVSGGTLALATRFFVACAHPQATPPAPLPAAPVRRAPPDQVPVIPSDHHVVAFVDAVDEAAQRQGTPRITNRIAAVFGGSLGGNLGLRLGRRRPRPPWLRNVVTWSPASVWKAKVKHDPGREGTRVTRDNYTREPVDVPQSRVDHFHRGGADQP